MSRHDDIDGLARAIIDANLYMTLGTADRDGRPWASPVYFAADGYREFYWTSDPEAKHSRNLAQRPELSIVIFDSTVPAYHGQAVYMSATAEQLAGPELERALQVYPGPPERGGSGVTVDMVQAPAAYRLYRATVSAHFVLCPRGVGEPCALHERAVDHRAEASP
jgi:pyridoxamine 5'-phosphate oxidase-like protein